MDINATHKSYDGMADTWLKCRDTAIGLRAVLKRGVAYLPLLGGQDNAQDKGYISYQQRAQFFNAVARTIDTMSGHIFRKQPVVKLPTALQAYKSDIDMGGISLEGFIGRLIDEVLEVGRCGLLVEYPQRNTDETLTVQQSTKLGLRPYLTSYKAEDIRYWRTGRVNNATVLVQVLLGEKYEDDDGGEHMQIRELHIDDGSYGQRIHRQTDNGWVIHEEFTPTMNGAEIAEIPFYFLGIKEMGAEIQSPPLEGLADTCLGFYRNSADYENALHVAGTPTPWINGITEPKDFPAIHLGSNTFLKLPPDAQAGFLQCGADGVAALKEAMMEKKQEMAAQGAQMLREESRTAESGNALAIKRGGENSILANIASSTEMVVAKALRFMADWVGANPDDVTVELNKDYIPSAMDANLLREWGNQYLSGAISFETYFEGMIQGELVSEGLTADDERERKELDAPALASFNDVATNDSQ